jgi:hypothetical protein
MQAAGAHGPRKRTLQLRARGAGATAIPVGLVAVLDTVLARRGLAEAGPADLAQAIGAHIAAFAYGAARAAWGTAAVGSGFIVVSNAVQTGRRLARRSQTHTTQAVVADFAGLTRWARSTRPTAIIARLADSRIPLIIAASHWDASHAVANKIAAAGDLISNTRDARAVIANPFARLGARDCVRIWLCQRLHSADGACGDVFIQGEGQGIRKANGFRSSRDCARRTAMDITLNPRSTHRPKWLAATPSSTESVVTSPPTSGEPREKRADPHISLPLLGAPRGRAALCPHTPLPSEHWSHLFY